MKRCFLSATLLASCTPHPKEIPDKQWLLNAIKTTEHGDGWDFTATSGGGSSWNGEIAAEISLKGKTPGQALNELQSLVAAHLKDAGYTIDGSGQSSGDKGMTGFALSVRTPDSVANIVFSSAPVGSSKLVLAIAIAQQRKTY